MVEGLVPDFEFKVKIGSCKRGLLRLVLQVIYYLNFNKGNTILYESDTCVNRCQKKLRFL